MKKKFMLTISIVCILVMVACGNNEDQSNSENSSGKQELLLWHYYTGSEDALNEILADYNDSQENYEVVAEYVPFDEMNRQLSVGTAGDTLPDIVISDTVNNVSMASMGILADITDKLDEWGNKDKFLDGPMDSTVYQDKNYGLPLTTNALGLFYNKQLLEESGIEEPPTTWEELEEVAASLTTDNVKGFGMSAVRSEEATFQMYPFLLSAGATYENLDSPEAMEAFSLIHNLLDKGYMGQDVLTSTQDDLTRMFTEGNLAMMINGPWMIDRIQENENIDFGITYIPKSNEFKSTTGGDNIAITKSGEVDQAWDFITWLFEPEQNERFAMETGYYPTRSDVLNEAEYWQNQEHVKDFVPIMEIAEPRGPSSDWPSVSEAIQLAIQKAMTNDSTIEEALEEASTKIEEIQESE
ncbi:multiple sugar transport system substrate-binding protein [Gracilibacillus orientalis]|uniref:Multiple sugar transport system substrate-binding protein n=1 Tax=Gracilibacillus orientalis TaxID=334253 RepID=A0A1I4GX80_9BACI|nr:ABC transporter substrate-binding protein [Gracilibacillus orientalis]SFL33746.1 multiple sugar transport system substrate-binding protein [Gracilibacillus orientalis]